MAMSRKEVVNAPVVKVTLQKTCPKGDLQTVRTQHVTKNANKYHIFKFYTKIRFILRYVVGAKKRSFFG